jgi:hypothetical protein
MDYDFFWLMCGFWVGCGSYLIGKIKAKELIEAEEYSEEEANEYLKKFSIWIIAPSTIFWLLQVSAGPGIGVDFLLWPNPQKFLALFILVFLWGYLLVWTLFLGGAVPLGRCLRLVGNFPKFMINPILVKGLVILLVISGVTSLFM